MTYLDFQTIQGDLAYLLLSDPELQRVSITPRDLKLDTGSRLPDEAEPLEALVYLTERNGRKGCGVIVERPEVNTPGQLRLKFIVIEDRMVNGDPTTGTFKSADFVGQRILDLLDGYSMGGVGNFEPDQPALREIEEMDPLRAYRVVFLMDYFVTQTARLMAPAIAEETLTLTLTNDPANASADIWFTTDATYPGPANPSATKYSAPFTVASGTTVRYAAHQADYRPSSDRWATIT